MEFLTDKAFLSLATEVFNIVKQIHSFGLYSSIGYLENSVVMYVNDKKQCLFSISFFKNRFVSREEFDAFVAFLNEKEIPIKGKYLSKIYDAYKAKVEPNDMGTFVHY